MNGVNPLAWAADAIEKLQRASRKRKHPTIQVVLIGPFRVKRKVNTHDGSVAGIQIGDDALSEAEEAFFRRS